MYFKPPLLKEKVTMVSDTQSSSSLLSPEENETVARLLGERCVNMVMSVVQVYQTTPPDHGSWKKRDAGVLVLVKDSGKRSYFFRLYCLTRRALVWEHELYSNMEQHYNTPKPFFHMFEAEDCVTGFNFADEREANAMSAALKEKAARKRIRQEKKRQPERQAAQMTHTRDHLSSPHSLSTPTLSNGSSTTSTHHRTAKGKVKRSREGKKKLSKADIGHPQDFKHVSHVGWNPNTGFDIEDRDDGLDPTLKQFLEKAGVSETQMQDKNTRDFIYDFIKNHGGIDRVKNEVQVTSVPPPPVPARNAPTNSSIRSAPPPPPPPSRTQLPPPPPPSQASVAASASGPPPPPPLRSLPQRQDSTKGAPTPPPPPPPPPVLTMAPPPPPPGSIPAPPSAAAPAMPDPRSALMDAIRSGKALKPVVIEEKNRNGGSGDTRAELMDQIRQGKELKAVSKEPKESESDDGDIVLYQNCSASSLCLAIESKPSDCVYTEECSNGLKPDLEGVGDITFHHLPSESEIYENLLDSSVSFSGNSSDINSEHIYINIKNCNESSRLHNEQGQVGSTSEVCNESNLLKCKLKSVVPAPRPPPSNCMPSDSLAGALQKALAERLRATHSDSSGSSSENEEDDEDEWED
ncbi:Wiskott-Aldrich syndrome protein [Frankliniella fusca]|uniref:Wiskott-Aldrich syndrome protein n=1 Tax=Frankliniella fusca TaxID=407009 RepID=A0AAE1LJ39_9NEOP|nr:Wiskott-Aldrich syndrome protein [Frankliniella fusca]